MVASLEQDRALAPCSDRHRPRWVPHTMAWLGSVFDAKVNALGPVTFAATGVIADLYDEHRLSASKITNAVIGTLAD